MMFPRRNDATNKELILTIIDIQGYLSRYGKSHTNWHETLNEVIERLEQAESAPQESKEVPQRKSGKWIKASEHECISTSTYIFRCSECGETFVGAWSFCPHCGADMRWTG